MNKVITISTDFLKALIQIIDMSTAPHNVVMEMKAYIASHTEDAEADGTITHEHE